MATPNKMNKTTISKTAWHYRWLKHLGLIKEHLFLYTDWNVDPDEYPWGKNVYGYGGPKSICPYFWLLAVVTWIPLTLAGAFVTFMVRFPMFFGYTIVGLIWLAAFFAAAYLVAFLMYLLFRGLQKLVVNVLILYLQNREPRQPVVRGDSTLKIAWQVVKAKKEKVCPLIEIIP